VQKYALKILQERKHVFLAKLVLLLAHFGVDHFGTNFTKIKFFSFAFFLISYFSIFLIYKKIFSQSFSVFISKTVKDFLFILLKFLSTLHKKVQVQTHLYCFFIWLFQ